MLKITHFTNSFIAIKSRKSIIVCDPWVGRTTDNGWISYPIDNSKKIDKEIFNADYIYISHLHCDHLDFKTLKLFKNKKLKFIIKKYENGHLKKKLEKFTHKKILELDPYEKRKINNDFTIAIVPQIISNVRNLKDDIQYDLDTSIIIQSNRDKTLFYNNVDMPINPKVLKQIKEFIFKKFKKHIDVFCCALGAASEFPQTFLNINRNYEKIKIIKKSLENLNKYIKILKPRVFFPAGGTYTIYGKYKILNKYIAQPEFDEILKNNKDERLKIYNLIGGNILKINNYDFQYIENFKNNDKIFKNKFINRTKYLKYYYKKKIFSETISKLDQIFDSAKSNYFKVLKKKNINGNWKITFNIYKNLELNDRCKIDFKASEKLKMYQLINLTKKTKKINQLTCYMEANLFSSLLKGEFPWNTSVSGSTIFFKRYPNKYDINQVFSLNFLRSL